MSHNIKYATYPENCNKAKVQKEWDNYVAHEDRQEGASGLGSSIRWIDHVCSDSEEAKEYIKERDSGWYDQLAVKFLDYPELIKTQKLLKLEQRASTLRKKLFVEERKVHAKELKSAYVSCKGCGSRLSTEHIVSNFCPLCRTDLRSPSVLNSIEKLRKQANTAEEAAKAEYRRCCEKQKRGARVCWLVKIEYHT